MSADDIQTGNRQAYDRYPGVALASLLGLACFITFCSHYLSFTIVDLRSWAIFTAFIATFAILVSRFPPGFRVLGLIPPTSLLLLLNMWMDGPVCINGLMIGLILGAAIKYLWFDGVSAAGVNDQSKRLVTAFDAFIALLLGSQICFLHFHSNTVQIEGSVLRNTWYIAFGFCHIYLLYVWIRLFRPFFELCVEAVVWRNYRITSVGPGAAGLPIDGSLIVIANHACWWDPLFLAKVLPRPVTPMMTSLFYDKWYLKPLMKYVFGTIRVEDARMRREAPEIQEAIRALDDGKCLVLFPESFLRRKEEVPLRRFGRGIWEILKARPDTPVVCCWIEGAWGSYSSYWNGPPTKNKVKERRRPISIGMAAPITVPVEKLQHHLATRIYLMNEVSAARTHLGLPALPPFELPAKDDEPAPEQPA